MTIDDLKLITGARLESSRKLMEAGDWFFASYAMAMTLEVALKALICKTLNISSYPQNQKQQKVVGFFWTHEFEQMLLLAGLSDTIGTSGSDEVFQNWSDFTKEFPGAWTSIRYDYDRQSQFDRTKTERLFNALTHPSYGLLIKIKEKW